MTDGTHELRWARERDGFAREDAAERADGHDDYPGGGHVPEGGVGLPLLGEAFVELATELLKGQPDVAAVLSRLVETGLRVVPAADLVSVTLRRQDESSYATPVQTDRLATELDQAQYEHREGPCVTALEKGGLGTAGSSDLAADPQWTRFGPAAAKLGAGSVFAVGLFPVGDPPLRGALNLYAHEVGGFGVVDRDAALVLASHAAVALAYVQAGDAAALARTQLAEARADLNVAKASRDVIGQAKGLLMERQGLTAEEAFDTLRRASQHLNVKLREVAETFVARRHEL